MTALVKGLIVELSFIKISKNCNIKTITQNKVLE